MTILRDIPISLTAGELLASQGPSGQQRALMSVAEKAIALGQGLFAPAAIYEEFDVFDVTQGRVVLRVEQQDYVGTEGRAAIFSSPTLPHSSTPLSLTVGPKADLTAPAERLLVAVYTIGSALETRVSELHRAGEPLLSYLVDCAGVLALGAVGERVRCLAEGRAAERGWGLSPALSPGSLVGWSVQGQRELCDLLPIADIGVRLNEYCVLEPHKSASVVIGMGPEYESHEVGSVCRYCSLRKSCWRRRKSQA